MDDNYNNERPEVVTGGPSGPSQSNALGVTGLVLGILGVIFAICCYPLGLTLGVIAIILGFIAKSKNQKFAMASIILGFVSLGLGVLIIILGKLGASFLENFDWENWINQMESMQ